MLPTPGLQFDIAAPPLSTLREDCVVCRLLATWSVFNVIKNDSRLLVLCGSVPSAETDFKGLFVRAYNLLQ